MSRACKSWNVLLVIIAFLMVVTAKRNYKIEFEGVDLVRDPKFLLQLDYCRVSKFNQTSYAFSMAGNWTEPCPDDAFLSLTAYQKMGNNAYSKIPVKLYTGSYREFFLRDPYVMPTIVDAGNFKRRWPVPKGPYTVTDFVPDVNLMPEEVPGERWRIDFTITSKNRIIFRMFMNGFIDRNV